nr:hypothetical protein [Tanacetum cinerariifolium]
ETAAASVIVHREVKPKDKGKCILIKKPKPLKRQAQIEQDEAFARQLEAELNANINWNEVIKQVQRKERQYNTVMRYQALKRKPVTEAQARKNMMIYVKNMAGFKIDFFKGNFNARGVASVYTSSSSLAIIYRCLLSSSASSSILCFLAVSYSRFLPFLLLPSSLISFSSFSRKS